MWNILKENNDEKPEEIAKVNFHKKLEISDCLIGLYSQELSNDQCIEMALEKMDLRLKFLDLTRFYQNSHAVGVRYWRRCWAAFKLEYWTTSFKKP